MVDSGLILTSDWAKARSKSGPRVGALSGEDFAVWCSGYRDIL